MRFEFPGQARARTNLFQPHSETLSGDLCGVGHSSLGRSAGGEKVLYMSRIIWCILCPNNPRSHSHAMDCLIVGLFEGGDVVAPNFIKL